MVSDMVEVTIGRIVELKVHDALQYEFEDLLQEFVSEEEAGGEEQKVRTMYWAEGVAMWIVPYYNPTSAIMADESNGIIHYRSVTYAIREKFVKREVRGNVTINFLDQNEIPKYRDLARELKRRSNWIKDNQTFQKKLKKIEKEVGELSGYMFEFFRAGYELGLPTQQITDQLKEIKNKN